MPKISIKACIKSHIAKSDESVFLREDFAGLGGYDQIGRALRHLVNDGSLINVGYGIYVKAIKDPISGEAFLIDTHEIVKQAVEQRLELLGTNNSSRDVHIPPNRPINSLPGGVEDRLSKRLGLEFPYDWSNSKMSENLLIKKVIEKSRFNDLMRMAYYYGLPRLRASARECYGSEFPKRLDSIFNNIEIGFMQHKESKL